MVVDKTKIITSSLDVSKTEKKEKENEKETVQEKPINKSIKEGIVGSSSLSAPSINTWGVALGYLGVFILLYLILEAIETHNTSSVFKIFETYVQAKDVVINGVLCKIL